MAEGMKLINYVFDPSTGKLVMAEDNAHLDALITPDEVDCTTAGVDIVAANSGFDRFVKFLSMYNSNAAAQTFALSDAVGTKFTTKIGAGETVTWMSDTAVLVLDAGAITGTAGTGNHIKVCMTYFERKA